MPARTELLFAAARNWQTSTEALVVANQKFIVAFLESFRVTANVLNCHVQPVVHPNFSTRHIGCCDETDQGFACLGRTERPWTLRCGCTAPVSGNTGLLPPARTRPASCADAQVLPAAAHRLELTSNGPIRAMITSPTSAPTLHLLAAAPAAAPAAAATAARENFFSHRTAIASTITLSRPRTHRNSSLILLHRIFYSTSSNPSSQISSGWAASSICHFHGISTRGKGDAAGTSFPGHGMAASPVSWEELAAPVSLLPLRRISVVTSPWMSGSAAAATSPGTKGQQEEPQAAAGGLMERIPILPPRHRHQPPLPRDASKSLWRTAEELAAAGKLLRLQVGKSGVTRALMARAGHLLEHHQLIRLNVLQNCSLDVRFVAWLAENALDCQCIKVKGRTATLFRQKGLPRPPASFPTDPLEPQPAVAAAVARSDSSTSSSSKQLGGPVIAPAPSTPSTLSPPLRPARAAAAPPTVAEAAGGTPASAVSAPTEGPGAAAAYVELLQAHQGLSHPAGRQQQQREQERDRTQGPDVTTSVSQATQDAEDVAASGSYRGALAARFRQWSATRDARRLRLRAMRQQ